MAAPNPLDGMLPIRRILLSGDVQPFVVDIDFDGDTFAIEIVDGVLRVVGLPATSLAAEGFYASTPEPIGTAAVGDSVLAAPGNHSHALGPSEQVIHTVNGPLVANKVNILTGACSAMTVPAASTWAGGRLIVKKRALATVVTLTRSGSDLINNGTTWTMTPAEGYVAMRADISLAVIDAFGTNG